TVHSTLSSIRRESARTRMLAPLVRRLYKRADVVVAVSDGVRRDLVANWEVDPQRVRVIYNPVVSPRLFVQAGERPDTPAFDRCTVSKIVAVGRLSRVKRFDLLIRAVKLASTQRPMELFIIGDGAERARLQSLIDELGVRDRVHLLGERSNPHPFTSRADVFALSSDYEGM